MSGYLVGSMNDLMTVAHLIGIDNVVLCGETINEGELHLTEINV